MHFKTKQNIKPPILARWLLHRMSEFQSSYLISGDLDEAYQTMTRKKSRTLAKLWYWMQTIYCLPNYTVNLIMWRISMLRSYFKSATRNIIKNRLFSMISIIGLALAVGCFTVSFISLDTLLNMDGFHEKASSIYYLESMIQRTDASQVWGITPLPLAASMQSDLPQVQNAVRIKNRTGVFTYGDKKFEDPFLFVDDGFLDMFSFPLIMGDQQALHQNNSVVITQDYAEKYFRDENPMNKVLTLAGENGFHDDFIVRGVLEDISPLSSIEFNILLPLSRLPDWEDVTLHDWSEWAQTFVLIENQADLNAITNHLSAYLDAQNEANSSWAVNRIIFEPITRMAENAHQVRNSLYGGPGPATYYALVSFGLFLLLLAAFNYINISIATSTRRLREIGIRKVLGSTRVKLIIQFFSENFLICLFGILLGGVFAGLYLIPQFNIMFNSSLAVDLDNPRLWMFYLVTLLFTASVSGGYPSLYISRFKPVAILRSAQKIGGGSKLTKIFLTFQYVLTFIMIGTGFVFVENAKYQERIDWGYNQDQVIVVPLDDAAQFSPLKNRILQNPDILRVSGSRDHLSHRTSMLLAKYNSEEYQFFNFSIGAGYAETMEMTLLEGRLFDETRATDPSQAIVVNEKLKQHMGWNDPLQEKLLINDRECHIIGVVGDFFYREFTNPLEPVILNMCAPNDYSFMAVRVRKGQAVKTNAYLRETWDAIYPDSQYNGFYQSQSFDHYFRINRGIYQLSLFVALVALAISCMGLFGLISVSIVKRTKEFSIRKVLGAGMTHVIRLLNRDLIRVLAIALIIATPLCWFMMDKFMAFSYANRAPMTAIPFILAALLLVTTSLLSVLFQIIKAARSPIIENLRIE